MQKYVLVTSVPEQNDDEMVFHKAINISSMRDSNNLI